MDSIRVCGGNTLCGELDVQGSKNGALPVLAASILVEGRTVIKNCPDISDVDHMLSLLKAAGCEVSKKRHTIEIDAKNVTNTVCPKEHANVMRSSVLLLGALLARTGEVSICYPGGCVIGKRPINYHIDVLQQMGVVFLKDDDCIYAKKEGICNRDIYLSYPSVGATENAILYAVLCKRDIGMKMNASIDAKDEPIVLHGCAREPEIVELCRFLQGAGVRIVGAGTDVISISGAGRLQETCYRIMPDRIVAGTYLLAGAVTRGIVVLNHAPVWQMKQIFSVLQEMGADLAIADDWVCINGENVKKPVRSVSTGVYPGFPTDLQSALMVAACMADGCSIIEETIFENRFHIVPELCEMGADIHVLQRRAVICGVPHLRGSNVCARELRGGAALVMAGLVADGETTVSGYRYIKRGYENICRDLKLLGAKIVEV